MVALSSSSFDAILIKIKIINKKLRTDEFKKTKTTTNTETFNPLTPTIKEQNSLILSPHKNQTEIAHHVIK